MDDLRQILGVQQDGPETASEIATRFSLPFTLALVLVLLAAALAMQRRS